MRLMRIRTGTAKTDPPPPPQLRRFLFLQGPITPFFQKIGAGLRVLGHEVHRVNLCLGDRLFWRGPGAVDFCGRPAEWPGWIDRFLAEKAITDLVLLGEQRLYHRQAIAAARARGVAVTVTDFGYLRPDWITLEQDGMGGDSRFPGDPAEIHALAEGLPPLEPGIRYRASFFTQAVWDMAYHLATLLPWPFPHYRSHQLHHPLLMYAGIGRRLPLRHWENCVSFRRFEAARAKGPVWLFAMQMETDFSVRAYSRYRDMDTPIAETVASFCAHAPPNGQLMVKAHPLDPCVKNWKRRIARIARKAGVEGRVHYLPGGVLDHLILASQGTITVNSTVGVRCLVLNRPVLALGQAVYDVPGLVHRAGLDSFWGSPTQPDPVLVQDFLRAMAGTVLIRGVYYGQPGLDAAVTNAVQRLHHGLINQRLPAELV
jgi:capsular polysaccharide export protein